MDEQMAAATELIKEGMTATEAAKKLQETFGISLATAYRRCARVVDGDDWEEDEGDVDYGSIALAAIADSIDAARKAKDWDALADRGERLAAASAKLKIRRAARPVLSPSQ